MTVFGVACVNVGVCGGRIDKFRNYTSIMHTKGLMTAVTPDTDEPYYVLKFRALFSFCSQIK